MTTVNQAEVDKFSKISDMWWQPEGKLWTLHRLNPVRIEYIKKYASGNKLLDVGCGGGLVAEPFSRLGYSVYAIDASKQNIEVANAHKGELDIKYEATPVENYSETGFDTILCLEMIEHVQNPSLLIKCLAEKLNSGGTLVVSTINRNAKSLLTAKFAAEYILNLLPKGTHDFKKFLKPSEINAMAEKEGLTLIAQSGVGFNPFSKKFWLTDNLDVNYMQVYKQSSGV
jgi:2-polyprenyl-6-hydroxyphenyl methylase / 3-demethylubiquinone-9 3-methyltransferase